MKTEHPDLKQKMSTRRGTRGKGTGRRAASAGEAKPARGNRLAPRIASSSGSRKLASDDCGIASEEK